jgi:hypothetical protein
MTRRNRHRCARCGVEDVARAYGHTKACGRPRHKCELPVDGVEWACRRAYGHEGPCALEPVGDERAPVEVSCEPRHECDGGAAGFWLACGLFVGFWAGVLLGVCL